LAKAKSTAEQENFRFSGRDAKAAVTNVNVMAPGSAIPWEDRGTVGMLPAFFKTAFGVMFHPAITLTKMRRPETSNDARMFAWACGAVWFFAVIIQSAFAWFVFYSRDKSLEPDSQQYMINTLLEAVLACVGAAFLPKLISWMFYRLTAFDMTSKAPPVLVENCITFLMGASLLALIPGGTKPWLAFGPMLAGLWMFVLLLITAISRLRVRAGAAIIGSVLTFLGTTAIVVGGIFAIQFLWCTLLGKASLPPVELTTPGHQLQ
jgi:hypothetical protein